MKTKKLFYRIIVNLLYNVRSYWAILLYKIGVKPSCSTFIDEETITVGYGKLDSVGYFQYDLPRKYVHKLFKGCDTWDDYLKKCD